MIQLLPKVAFNAGYGGTNTNMSVFGGMGDFAYPTTFGIDYAKAPIVLDSVFRIFTILSTTPFSGDLTITLYVDGVATTQVVTLPAGEMIAVSTGADVAVTAGQDCNYHYAGQNTIGRPIGFCLEREGEGNVYGLTPATGSQGIGAGSAGVMGGAFNNGVLGNAYIPGLTVDPSLTYSIVAVSGTMTTLMLRTYALDNVPDAGVWTAYARVNQVLQDGTGGTVDTACVLTGAATVATSTFSLPLTIGQRVDIVLLRSVAPAAYALAQVGVGVGFTPSTADAFMCCGGDNNLMLITVPDWKWPASEQLGVGESSHVAPISTSGLHVTGLYVERPDPPVTGGYVHTIRLSGTDTLAAVTIQGAETSGLIDGLSVPFVYGDRITLQAAPFPIDDEWPLYSRLYWGMAAMVPTEPPPPPPPPGPTYETVTLMTRRLRRASHLTDEHQWLTYDKFQVDLQAGVGLTDGQGEDPQVMVRWSNDGGHTWSNEHWTTAGRQGARKTRVIVRQTGRARVRTFEIVVSDPVAWCLAAAYLDVTPGNGS